MDVTEAYRVVAKHIFVARLAYSIRPIYLIVLADNVEEARAKAEKYFSSRNIVVLPLMATHIPNVYEI